MRELNLAAECMKRCPELHACAAEFALRSAMYPELEIGIEDIIEEHRNEGTLPFVCADGPSFHATGGTSYGKYEDVAQATIVKIDAWGSPVVIKCSAQGYVGGGNIREIQSKK